MAKKDYCNPKNTDSCVTRKEVLQMIKSSVKDIVTTIITEGPLRGDGSEDDPVTIDPEASIGDNWGSQVIEKDDPYEVLEGNGTPTDKLKPNTIVIQADFAQTDEDHPGFIKNKMTTSSTNVFWVNGFVPTSGDGSVINPFKTIKEALDAVVGSGTPSSPQHLNATIKVFSSTYSLAPDTNLCVNSLTIHCDDGVKFTWSGYGYLIDSSTLGTMNLPFKITGFPSFDLANGCLLRNVGGNMNNETNREMYIEVYNAIGNPPPDTANDKGFIENRSTEVVGGWKEPHIVVVVKGFLWSYRAHTVVNIGCASTTIKGYSSNAKLCYGNSTSGEVGVAAGRAFLYKNPSNGIRANLGHFMLEDLQIMSSGAGYAVEFSGYHGFYSSINRCRFGPSHGSAVLEGFICFGDWRPLSYGGNPNPGKLVMEGCTFLKDVVVTNNTECITFTGSDVNFNKFRFQGCFFDTGLSFDHEAYSESSTFNVIDGKFTITNPPTSSTGLIDGTVYSTSGSLNIK